MQGNQSVIDYMNELLSGELAARDQYFIHSRLYSEWGYNKLFERLNHEMEEETTYAEDFIRRILMLGGTPKMTRAELNIGIDVISCPGAVRMLGSMNAADAIQGIIALKFMLDYLKEFMIKATEMEGSEGAAAILMGLAVSCVILSVAVYMLGSMDTGKAIQGIIALGAIIAILSGFMYVVSKNPFMAKGAGIL